jgi:GR25 family glycosyltransferase involved in LPS biosynthesis
MPAFNEFFDAVYVLNLSKRTDRMAAMTARLEASGIRFERHEALSGAVLDHYFRTLKGARPFANANYVACALSHLSIYNKALERGQTSILILEDDILLHEDADALTRRFMDEVRHQGPTWDLLHLAYIPLTDDRSQWSYPMLEPHRLSQTLVRSRNLWSLMGYAVSARLMRHLVAAYNSKMPMELDRYFVDHILPSSEWACWAPAPQIVATFDDYSDNALCYEAGLRQKSVDTSRASLDQYK